MTDVRARDAVVPGALAFVAALVVVAVGLLSYGGHLSRFVHAGTFFVQPRDHLVLQKGAGYDGQFLYRLALAPFDLRTTAHGITFDTPLREQRIGLPLLAWALSLGGHAALLPYALVVIEVLSLTAVGALGGLIAAGAGRRPVWGLLLASPAALVFSVLHDLTEPLEIALIAGGLLLWWSRRPVAAGFVLAAAVLTRETAALLVVAIAVPRLVALVRQRRPARADVTWLLPAAAFAGWGASVVADTGRSPLGQGSQDNLGAPFAGIVGLARSLPQAAWHEWPLMVLQLALTAWLLALVVPLLRSAPAPLPGAFALFVLLAVCGATVVWAGYDDLRFLVELSAVALLVVLRSGVSLRWYAVASTVVWVVSLAANRF